MSVKTPDSQVGGTTASLEICVILVQLSNAYSPIALTLSPICTFLQVGAFAKARYLLVVHYWEWLQKSESYNRCIYY